ncbi:hypothetical protein AGMMS49579_01230 [Spirochaetia bacterium]|nr:hypothetical protein AGMMS49579_01230 [Spirochaetia bacterium]
MMDNENSTIEDKSLIKMPLFKQDEIQYVDPPIVGQTIALISIIPCKDAIPNKHGIYAYAKIRGVFQNEIAASEKAKDLIQNYDFYNSIKHVLVGQPFPITMRTDFSEKIDTVYKDINKNAKEDISNFIRKEGEEDKRKILEIKNRAKILEEESKKPITLDMNEMTEDEIIEKYITLRKGIATGLFHYMLVCKQQLFLLENQIKQKLNIVNEMDEKYPYINTKYMDIFEKKSKEVGIDIREDETSKFILKSISTKPDINKFIPNINNISFYD